MRRYFHAYEIKTSRNCSYRGTRNARSGECRRYSIRDFAAGRPDHGGTESNIPDYSRVTRVLRDENGIYEVTVRRDSDNEVLYVDQAGRLVRQQTVAVAAPVQTTQTQTIQAAPVSGLPSRL